MGVALPIPEPWGEQLRQVRLGFGEARAATIPTHVTLLPPTEVELERCADLEEHLGHVATQHPAFPVVLRGTGTFRPVSDVVYIQVARGVASCEELERSVRQGPISRVSDFPYHPHVTVAHDVDPATLDRAFDELAPFHCEFTADRFKLYVHNGDGVWRTLREYPLTG